MFPKCVICEEIVMNIDEVRARGEPVDLGNLDFEICSMCCQAHDANLHPSMKAIHFRCLDTPEGRKAGRTMSEVYCWRYEIDFDIEPFERNFHWHCNECEEKMKLNDSLRCLECQDK